MRVWTVLAVLVGALAFAGTGAAALAPVQPLASLLRTERVFAKPGVPTRHVVADRRPLTRQRTVLPVTGSRRVAGTRWLRVLLPGRPNGHQGWIRASGARLASTPWRVVVDRARRRLTIYRRGRALRSFAAVVGKPSTPTPHGSFFVEEAIVLPSHSPGWPYAFALSARSDVFQEFDGGPGQIAIHGTYAIGGTPGTAVSHGCIRLDSAALRWMVTRFGSGTPVTIR